VTVNQKVGLSPRRGTAVGLEGVARALHLHLDDGRNALDMMMFGSTTNHVVRRASCPVLTLKQ
jgi:nucleotide-binding universal stress UspA family protein